MNNNRTPLFEKGRILKREMLEDLRDYPRIISGLLTEDLSPGIICGMELRVHENTLTIEKGLLKHNGAIYYLAEDHDLIYESTGRETMLKLSVGKKQKSPDLKLRIYNSI